MARVIRSAVVVLALSLFTAVAHAQSAKATPTDAQIKQAIINESIASYAGNCPCPYNTDRRGHACGRRSAYSRPGGASPVCYESDVTPKMVAEYRASHGPKGSSVQRRTAGAKR